MSSITTIRADKGTVDQLKKFRLFDQEPLETVIQRLMKAADRNTLVKQVADEIETRMKKNKVKVV